MAVTWDVKITPLDVSRREVSVTGVRTDDTTGEVQTHHINSALIATAAQKMAVLDQLWQMHLDWDARQALIDSFIGSLEADAKANLEARE